MTVRSDDIALYFQTKKTAVFKFDGFDSAEWNKGHYKITSDADKSTVTFLEPKKLPKLGPLTGNEKIIPLPYLRIVHIEFTKDTFTLTLDGTGDLPGSGDIPRLVPGEHYEFVNFDNSDWNVCHEFRGYPDDLSRDFVAVFNMPIALSTLGPLNGTEAVNTKKPCNPA